MGRYFMERRPIKRCLVKRRAIWQSFLSIVFPNLCLHCDLIVHSNRNGKNAVHLCQQCEFDLDRCVIPSCEQPGLTASGRTIWGTWYYRLNSPIRSLHRSLKFDGNLFTGSYIGSRLQFPEGLRKRICSDTVCIPVPSHRTKILERGIQHTSVLAESVAKHLSLRVASDVLRRPRLGKSQSDLNREDRLSNLNNAFSVSTSTPAKHAILVDDVMTTGATLDAAAATLESAGISVSLYTIAFRREAFPREACSSGTPIESPQH